MLAMQVFGSAANPIIKLCDLGVAKPRTELPQYGPVSGTKEWQVGHVCSALLSQVCSDLF